MASNEFIQKCSVCGGSGNQPSLMFWKKEKCLTCDGIGQIPDRRSIVAFVDQLEMVDDGRKLESYLPRLEAGLAAMNQLSKESYHAQGGRATLHRYRGLILCTVAEIKKEPSLYLEAGLSMRIAAQIGHGIPPHYPGTDGILSILNHVQSLYNQHDANQRSNAEQVYRGRHPKQALPF